MALSMADPLADGKLSDFQRSPSFAKYFDRPIYRVIKEKEVRTTTNITDKHGRPHDFFQRGAEFFENFTTYMGAFL